MKKLLTLILLGAAMGMKAQNVGINTADPKATLEVVGTPGTSSVLDGIIPPKLTRAQLIAKTGYGTDQIGAMVYITDLSGTIANGTPTANVKQTGYYTFDGVRWSALVSKVSAYVDAGVVVSLGNINVRLATGGNRSLEIAFTNAVARVSGTSINNTLSGSAAIDGSAITITAYGRQSASDGTSKWTSNTFLRWQPGLNFSQVGASQQILLNDETNAITYRITFILGTGWNNNLISIELL
ncbi:hypothetical protein [Pedobacter xixiisoli]|uniref:Uncharacterized protein n=1 Tax=Pedobacter xixiisoli TaxID=1476464 RepID=A0A286AE86_9SPHI|nr:hypothetical protein [Pedobacter xixiisoli]SOD20216.1 hypothetical protein SAMN06297358_3929 [Pedobacter xixiisoli]